MHDSNPQETLIVLAYPATEPYVFAAYSSLAAAALTSGKPTEVTDDSIQVHDNYLTGLVAEH